MTKTGKNGILFQKALLIAIWLLLIASEAEAFVCPNVTEVSPCDCYLFGASELPNLHCVGPDVSQELLNRVIAAVRRENNQTLDLNVFSVQHTNLTEVDLTPFEGGIFYRMYFESNPLLSRILGPDSNSTNSTDWDPIRVTYLLGLDFNNFQDEGLQIMFSYFLISGISTVSLQGNRLTGVLGQEFLPGFSNLSRVEYLYLQDNNIRVLGGGQFRGISRLQWIRMDNNQVSEIGEDAFVVDGTDFRSIRVDLINNSLSDQSFHPSSGISNSNRHFELHLEDNQFTKVREDRFLQFLDTHPDNSMDFEGNPIWCDPDMKWLKDRREEFESRVVGLDCANDPGQTAFTSSLVDG